MMEREGLTEREREILQLVSRGFSNQEIADQLVLSLGTVKWYNSQIYDKLGANNRAQAIVRATELGLFDAIKPLSATASAPPPHNLPAQLTLFVGRTQELTDIKGLLKAVRLVTITGPAGIGKTRLAQEFAHSQFHAFSDGIYFVSLAPLDDSENVIWAIAEVLKFQFRPGSNALQQLLDYLQQKNVLLILDNFEHLLQGVGIIPAILKATEQVRIIVTSRERLNLYGEVTYGIGGLALPEMNNSDELARSEAVTLFMQRATAVLPGLYLSSQELQQVGRICGLVEGLPLAIELASTWVDTLQLAEIAAEIEHSLDILQVERRDAPLSQNSMRAAFIRSWNLLDETQQTAFRRLAVFRGGFNRQAAAAVTHADLQTLHELVGKSLLRHDTTRGRYELHELLRHFAQEKLEASGEAKMVYKTHATCFANFINERWQQAKGHHQRQALLEIEADIENVRASWMYLIEEGNVTELKKMFHGLWVIYDVRGWYPAGFRLFEQAAEVMRTSAMAEARSGLGWLLAVQGMFIVASERSSRGGYDLAREGVHILEQLGEYEDMVIPLISLFITARLVGETVISVKAANDCLRITTEAGNQWGIVKAKQLLALKAIEDEDYAVAGNLASEALQICETRGDRWSESMICIEVLGTIAILQQQYETAEEWLFRGLRAAEAIDFKYAMQMAYFQLGYLAVLNNDHTHAAKHWHKALEVGEGVMGGMAIVGFFGTATTGDYKI